MPQIGGATGKSIKAALKRVFLRDPWRHSGSGQGDTSKQDRETAQPGVYPRRTRGPMKIRSEQERPARGNNMQRSTQLSRLIKSSDLLPMFPKVSDPRRKEAVYGIRTLLDRQWAAVSPRKPLRGTTSCLKMVERYKSHQKRSANADFYRLATVQQYILLV
ncbi:uncharacterized protein CIMG_13299 [Coccidioides immitis RS]|uniref:Uncharacterized protein n=3 Tax=Coccidioides immitis TaxID=5501 RepID=J3K479_COCIM|nr:uncharacterized protein CIMG_13299 [Coccidioides immitis RS]EAS29084.3 hypothetical protein CIMG_13299 [Coccidioides immitis RS]KMP06201.1 hypothetical protein CIRG_05882 [Coccidioides immitis RMSCC 2394]KMU91244.1 hypothetical protein CIHG_09056 [Coccidioides immitis H538.4]TPX22777.1 hypothetical protein DIZ76_014656 [Coccidioides immitis]